MRKGFTLIELLAVIVILALIALIAVPIVLNIIKDTKEKSALISVDNYLRAVENAVAKETMKNPDINYDGKYTINSDGKVISSTEKGDITIEFNGEGLKSGIIVIGDGKVRKVENVKTKDNYHVLIILGEVKLFKELKPAILTTGGSFNSKIKTLVTGTETKYYVADKTVKSIEFLGYGIIPSEYTLEEFQKLEKVDVSANGDETIYAIYDGKDKVYVYAEDKIVFNDVSSEMFYKFQSVETITFEDFIDTSMVKDIRYMFEGCSSLISLDLSNWNTINMTDMYYAFRSCSNLIQLNVSNWNTSNVTNMSGMFSECSSLTSLDVSSFDTSNISSLDGMFDGCKNLTSIDVSNFDTSSVALMNSVFSGCSNLISLDVSKWDTSKVEYMTSMFLGCVNLTTLDVSNWNTSSVISMRYMFSDCKKLTTLDLSNFDTSKVTDLTGMFDGCSKLTELDVSNFDTSKVTNMSRIFSGCSSLMILDIRSFDTNNVKFMDSMFYNTTNLKPIYVGEKWVIGEGTNITNMFIGSKTTSVEELCEPNSTEDWCIVS